jgi:hypothetical protein
MKTAHSPQLAPLLSDKRLQIASDKLLGKLPSTIQPNPTNNRQEVRLCSGIRDLDKLFGGGLTFGTVLESGIPFGNGGRRLLAQFIASATSGASGDPKLWCLWISARQQPKVYPPAWQAMGIDLSHLRFAWSESPVVDLKAVFLDDLFRVIVIDHPLGLKPEESVFLAQCARQQRKIILTVRDQPLTARDSNTAARFRFNILRPPDSNTLEIVPVRGLHQSAHITPVLRFPNINL